MKYPLLFIICALLCSHSIWAQQKSSTEFELYFEKTIKNIAIKTYKAGISGAIKAYYTDSLAHINTISQLKLSGAQLLQKTNENGDPIGFDTVLFNPDSIVPDFQFTYTLQTGKNGSITLVPKSIALIQTQIFPNNVLLHNVPFFADYNEVISKILNQNEVDFLNNYSQFKFYETNFDNREKKEDLKMNWVDLTNQQHYRTGPLVSSEILGEFVYEHLKSALFQSFDKNKILLKGTDLKAISNSDFTQKHTRQLPFSMGDPNTDYSQGIDTIIGHNIHSGWFQDAKYIDTVLPVLPTAFDSISFGKMNNKPTLFISQLNSNSKTFSTYYIALSDVKKVLYPGIYNWLELYFKSEEIK